MQRTQRHAGKRRNVRCRQTRIRATLNDQVVDPCEQRRFGSTWPPGYGCVHFIGCECQQTAYVVGDDREGQGSAGDKVWGQLRGERGQRATPPRRCRNALAHQGAGHRKPLSYPRLRKLDVDNVVVVGVLGKGIVDWLKERP